MRRILVLSLALAITFAAPAQEIRTNYRSGGITHISTSYQDINLGGIPAEVRLEEARFADGGTMYLLYLNLWQKTAVNVPKGVKMALNLEGSKLVRLEQIGQDSATKRRMENGLYLNRLKYALEPADLSKMLNGVKSVDIITGWDPDNYVQADFPANELSLLLEKDYKAIQAAAEETIELKATLSGYTENLNSTLTTANPVVARGNQYDYNLLLTHLYYKNNNTEDLDLAFAIGSPRKESYHFPVDTPVHFTLGDASIITLPQTRDNINFVYVYPSTEELERMVRLGVKSIVIASEEGEFKDEFSPREDGAFTFSEAVNQELQLLLSVSHR